MANIGRDIVTGAIVEEISLEEVTQFCAVRREKIVALVMEGIIDAQGRSEAEWRFDSRSLSRARRAVRLESDLEINLGAVAIILDLLDEIEKLRATRG